MPKAGRKLVRLSLIGCVMSLLGVATPALAYEDQLTVGAGLGYAYASDQPHHGLGLQLETSLGLDQAWTVRGLLAFSAHPGPSSDAKLNLGGELLYLFDLFEFVPYVGAGIDVLGHIPFEGTARAAFGVHPVVGMDWLVTREWLVGLSVRPTFVLTDWERAPIYLTVMLTGSLILDY